MDDNTEADWKGGLSGAQLAFHMLIPSRKSISNTRDVLYKLIQLTEFLSAAHPFRGHNAHLCPSTRLAA